MIKALLKNYKMILSLAKTDFKKRFVGSYFGILWMFLQPLATVLVYTLIFQVGFKTIPPVENVPYVLWLIPGIIPWFFFQETLLHGTQVLSEYNFLVKKVVFNVSALPLVKLCSTLLAHICFVIIMFIVFLVARVGLRPSAILIIYFSFATSVLSLAIIYFTSAVQVFFKDMAQIVGICLQFGMWMVPIMFDENIFMDKAPIVIKLLHLNPFYYIVKGYRVAMIGDVMENPLKLSIYFWVITFVLLLFSTKIFEKMKPHFADVL